MSKTKLLLTLTLLAIPATMGAQDLGIKAKKPVFGGAFKTCPWGAMADVVKAVQDNCPYCWTAVYKTCCPVLPPTAKVTGTASPVAISGTTTLNWYKPTVPGANPA